MLQRFVRPDRWFARCGRLECAVVERRLSGAPAFMRGLRALFVCDTHVRPDTRDEDIRAFAARLKALSPDVLLLGGDYADHAKDALRLFDALAALRPPLGAFACVGNNDAEAWGDLPRLGREMSRRGLRLLVNESVAILRNGGTLFIGGVDERKLGAPRAAGLYPDAPSPDVYRVLLSHYPCLPDAKPDLMLSGHTHGGQFNLLGLTPFAVGFEQVFRRDMRPLAVAGLLDAGDMAMLVSKGVGASRIQWRVGARPEIDLLIFD